MFDNCLCCLYLLSVVFVVLLSIFNFLSLLSLLSFVSDCQSDLFEQLESNFYEKVLTSELEAIHLSLR